MKKINFLAILLANLITAQSISLVKDIYPGVNGSSPQYLVNFNNKVYFSANHPDYGSELWVSDGTASGTNIISDILTGSTGQIPVYMTVFNNKIYYSALLSDSSHPNGLYSYDEVNGLKLVSENYKWSSYFTLANNNLYFLNNSYIFQMNAEGAIQKINESTYSNGYMGSINGNLIFGGRPSTDTSYSFQLYKFDGQTTSLLKTINPTSTSQPQEFFYSSALGKTLFSASDNTTSTEPWITDGTETGTYRLKDINTASQYSGSNPNSYRQIGDKVVFVATNSNNGTELYITDGTESGTKILKDINAGSGSSNPTKLTYLNDKIYFFANDGTNDAQLWETDGTETGTKLTLKLNPGSTNFTLGDMIAKDDYLLASIKMGVTPGQELYKIEVPSGTLSANDNNKAKIALYPNPTSGDIYFSNLKAGQFELFDLSGKKIQSGVVNSDSKIKLSAKPGNYIIKTVSEQGKLLHTTKVIIK
ncbi:T9SS type A sorting domain-containing protein [Chryseobacterium artocarpi]|nr:T9SS type A sorting domain-containing protein [Chryseobacterium artocarpi]